MSTTARAMRLVMSLALLIPLVACGESGSPCETEIRDAAAISASDDTVTDLDDAIRACASLAVFQAAADQFPDALDGVAAGTFIANRCAAVPDLADTALCVEVGQ